MVLVLVFCVIVLLIFSFERSFSVDKICLNTSQCHMDGCTGEVWSGNNKSRWSLPCMGAALAGDRAQCSYFQCVRIPGNR